MRPSSAQDAAPRSPWCPLKSPPPSSETANPGVTASVAPKPKRAASRPAKKHGAKKKAPIIIGVAAAAIVVALVAVFVVIPKVNASKGLQVGDVVMLGSYEQDGDTSDGEESIQWRVLTVDGDRAYLLSTYGLDSHVFNEDASDGNKWRSSDLKAWLEDDFASKAFSKEEKRVIDGAPTLLSKDEVWDYMDNDEDRICDVTQQAKDNGANTADYSDACHWWLRSAGDESTLASDVTTAGNVDGRSPVDEADGVVRPAIWVKLENGKVNIPDSADTSKKDSSKTAKKSKSSSKKAKEDKASSNSVQAGDTVEFGSYEQDGDTSDGKEAIEWRVLDVDGDRAYVVSEKGLAGHKFNANENKGNDWDSSDLKAWLEGTFTSQAFSDDERGAIDGSLTLLSTDEANKYFKSDDDRLCHPTQQATKDGVEEDDEDPETGCFWWLRSPGDESYCAADVDFSGGVDSEGQPVEDDSTAVRPAMWVNLKSAHLKVSE